MKFAAIIPARYASTRFPAKPLALLGGKPVVQHVYERVVPHVDVAVVAADDERIARAVQAFGGQCVMTSPEHRSGTDRCREAYDKLGVDCDVVINVQGDEPFIHPEQLRLVKQCFADESTQIATLAHPFGRCAYETLANPNSPKVVVDKNGFALCFSRSVVPYLRSVQQEEWSARWKYLKHIGLYAYRPQVLAAITALPRSPLEEAESLEQLRWLENGYRIKVAQTAIETIGIDTPADLQRAEEFLHRQSQLNPS